MNPIKINRLPGQIGILILFTLVLLVSCRSNQHNQTSEPGVILSSSLEVRRSEFSQNIRLSIKNLQAFAQKSGWSELSRDSFFDSVMIFDDKKAFDRALLKIAGADPAMELPETFCAALENRILIAVTPEYYSKVYPEGIEPHSYIKLLTHEMAHRLHIRILDGNEEAMGPVWFYEGFALCAANQFTNSDIRLSPQEMSDIMKDPERGSYLKYNAIFRYFASRVPLMELILKARDEKFNEWLITAFLDPLGTFFAKNRYETRPVPQFENLKTDLPQPIFDENPLFVEMYWKTWELAFRNFNEPAPGTGFVSQFIDAAFNANIFLWDTAIMTLFLNIAGDLTPGIGSLDNFYAKQHPSGEICREINRSTGIDFGPWVNSENLPLFSRWGFNLATSLNRYDIAYKNREVPTPNPTLTLDALNHPILGWAEMESYRWTGNKERLAQVREPLIRYYEALKKYIRQGNGLYLTDWASMDNSPRNPWLEGGGTGVDISAEMVLFARNLADLSGILGYREDSKKYSREADELSALINAKMWNPEEDFYTDLSVDGKISPVKSAAGFWTLLSQTATPEHARSLAGQLRNPATFGRLHPVPTLAADEAGYYPNGGYWCGAVWIATNTMIIQGLEYYGYSDLARDIALRHLDAMAQVYKRTGTIWENYAADTIREGSHINGGEVVKDMVGFSGVTPILLFLEQAIGLKPDAPKNELTWNLRSDKRSGCEKFRFNGHVVDLIAEPAGESMKIRVKSDGDFKLIIKRKGVRETFTIRKGEKTLSL